MEAEEGLVETATLIRREVDQVAVAYRFDLRTNQLTVELVTNPNAGKEDVKAYRIHGDPTTPVTLIKG